MYSMLIKIHVLTFFFYFNTNFYFFTQIRVNALIKRGSILIQQEKQTDGLDDFAKAVRLDPDNPDVYHHRGHVSLQRSYKFTMVNVMKVYKGHSVIRPFHLSI